MCVFVVGFQHVPQLLCYWTPQFPAPRPKSQSLKTVTGTVYKYTHVYIMCTQTDVRSLEPLQWCTLFVVHAASLTQTSLFAFDPRHTCGDLGGS